MKKIISAIFVFVAIASLAGATVLVPANTLGAGKWGYLGAASYGISSIANSNFYAVGGFGAYGVTDNLDVYAKVGYGVPSNPPAGVTSSAIEIGVAAKYLIVPESKDMPVSVSAVAGYQTKTTSITAPITMQTVEGDLGVGVIASKVMIPWVPYVALVYHSLNSSNVTGKNLELALGAQMLLSRSSAIVGEYSYNSIDWSGATSTVSKISVAYSAKL